MPAKLNSYMRRILISGCVFGLLAVCYLYAFKSAGFLHDIDLVFFRDAMRTAFPTALGLFGAQAGWGAVEVQGQSNAPIGVDTWCGKAYRAT